MNSVCLHVAEKWIASIRGRGNDDTVALEPEHSYGHSADYSDVSGMAVMTLWLDQAPTLLLKPFIEACSNREVALEVIRTLNNIAYKGLEIWTPEIIKDMFAGEHWFGNTTDAAFIEEFEGNHDEPFDPTEHSIILPSLWEKNMTDSGYETVGSKPKLTQKALKAFAKGASQREKNLVKAIVKVRRISRRVEHTDEETWGNTMAAFVFDWDGNDMLSHALDEIMNYRWETGEARECQLQIQFDGASSPEMVTTNVIAIEKLVDIQQAVGELYDAMIEIIESK